VLTCFHTVSNWIHQLQKSLGASAAKDEDTLGVEPVSLHCSAAVASDPRISPADLSITSKGQRMDLSVALMQDLATSEAGVAVSVAQTLAALR
jgi:hypothetical protein